MSAYPDNIHEGLGPPRLAVVPEGAAPPAAPVGERAPETADADDLSRRALADRITEDVLQLLFTAHQDLAEIAARGTADDLLVRSAQECTLGAIAVLRAVAGTILDEAWGPRPGPGPLRPAADVRQRVPFDALEDAWIVTVQHEKLLFASDHACDLLHRDTDELSELMNAGDGWARAAALHRPDAGVGALEFETAVPTPDGGMDRVRVRSYALPVVGHLPQAYISLLSLVGAP